LGYFGASFDKLVVVVWEGISMPTWQPHWPSHCSGVLAQLRSLQPGWTGYGNPA